MRGDYVYNRYIPGADGRFQRTVVEKPCPPPMPEPPAECAPPQPPVPRPPQPPGCAQKDGSFLRKLLPQGFDTGDLLILLILLLLLVDGDEDDTVSVLLTFAAFLLL